MQTGRSKCMASTSLTSTRYWNFLAGYAGWSPGFCMTCATGHRATRYPAFSSSCPKLLPEVTTHSRSPGRRSPNIRWLECQCRHAPRAVLGRYVFQYTSTSVMEQGDVKRAKGTDYALSQSW